MMIFMMSHSSNKLMKWKIKEFFNHNSSKKEISSKKTNNQTY